MLESMWQSVLGGFSTQRILADTTNAVLEKGVFGTTWQIALSSILCVILGALATSAGIGGGGLFVPLYAYVLGTGVKFGVPVSKATIFGGSIGKYLGTAFMKHPTQNRPVVNYNLVAAMQPWELLGTIFGVFFNVLFPELVIVILLVLVLGFSAKKTLVKGKRLWDKESKALKEKGMVKNQSQVTLADSSSDRSESPPNGTEDVGSGPSGMEETKEESGRGVVQPLDVEKHIVPEIRAEMEKEAKTFPVWNLAILAVMTVFIIIYSLVKKGVIGDLKGCTAGYWAWYFVPVPFFVGLSAFVIYKLNQDYQHKKQINWEYQPGDLQWDPKTQKKMPVVGFVAGVCASLVGIGGGMVTGPLFLELGLNPKVSSSSSAFMILFTGMSSVVQYLTIGYLPLDFALWFIFMGFLGAQLGHHSVKKILEKTGRDSLICFLLGGIIAVSVVIMFISGVISIATSPADELFEFSAKGMC
mmetsp:Transcript_20529/g.26572  ORF Transcript_20529/g.26572 Transcript_20529/m.26572 type:complete len:471 (+) Transcript_20529:59-1471(+)